MASASTTFGLRAELRGHEEDVRGNVTMMVMLRMMR